MTLNLRPHSKSEVVVVTGASAGVGRATVRAFAKRGARIGLIARGRDGLEGALADVESLGGKALILPCDVANANEVEAAAARVEEELGPIDIWVNNAMVSVFSPVKEMTAKEFKRVTEVTYLGAVYGTLAALRRMLPRDRGCIVQVGSALAFVRYLCSRRIAEQSMRFRGSRNPYAANYCMTKATYGLPWFSCRR